MTEYIIKFSDVVKKFNNQTAVYDLNFSLHPGTITTLIGPNGAGKTTVAKLALGIELPTSGKIYRSEKIKIGYVPQKLTLNPNLPINVGDFINFISNSKKASFKKDELASIIKNYRLNLNIDSQISKLSGGELQKLLLVSTIASKPNLLVLDEPMQGLDINSQEFFYDLIKRINIEMNVAIFMISHDLVTVMKNSSEIICLNKHICCRGKSSDILANENYNLMFPKQQIGIYKHNHNHSH